MPIVRSSYSIDVVPRLDPEDAQARRAEVAGVVAGVEADVVGAEHPVQELGPRRQQPVDLGRRERDVQEEADREVGAAGGGALAGRASGGSRAPRPAPAAG